MLSINFNVYGFGRDPSQPRYTMGHLVGTIGPYFSGEPKQFVFGRQMITFAHWTNLSETTFVFAPTDAEADYHGMTAERIRAANSRAGTRLPLDLL